jgi:hypothetical protein
MSGLPTSKAKYLQRCEEAKSYGVRYLAIFYMPGGWARWDAMPELSKLVIANDFIRSHEAKRNGSQPGKYRTRTKLWAATRMK